MVKYYSCTFELSIFILTRGPLDPRCAKCIGSEVCVIRFIINIQVIISKPHFTVYFVVYTSMFVYIVFIIFAAWVTLGGRLISTNPASAKNVLFSAWFFRAAYSSLKERHQSEIIKCASNYPVLSCDALAKITPSKRGMQTALDDVLHELLLMIMIGAPIKYVSNQRSPNMMSYHSRSITEIWSVLL